MSKKVLFISDMDQTGSGYMQISTNIAIGLAKNGYDVKCIGLSYKGEQHYHPFSIFPCDSFLMAKGEYHNLLTLWHPDVTVCCLDIHMQERILQQVTIEKEQPPYIGIFPVEGDPLCMDWALVISQMQGQFCISKFGTEECKKKGLPTEYIQIGIDTEAWRVPTLEEKKACRKALGYEEGDILILTVADNQERKNLSAAIEITSGLEKRLGKPVKHLMVTREFQPTGWKLRTLAQELGYNNLFIYERGLSFKNLLMMYFAADMYLNSAKAEGLCMPVLEAQAIGLPVFVTDCTSLHDLAVSDDRMTADKGFALSVAFVNRDVFGNSNRYFVDVLEAINTLDFAQCHPDATQLMADMARKAVEQRTWDITNEQLHTKIKELIGE